MVHAIVGTNWFGVTARLDELTKSFIKEYGELALEKLDGEDASYEQIQEAIESLPFLASKKMVIIHNLCANSRASEELDNLAKKAGDTTDLVIVESKLDKRSAYYKQLKKLANFQEFNELDEAQLIDWLSKEAKKAGAKLSRQDARYLVERAGISQTNLAHELEKLVLYNPEISKKTIELLVDENPSSTVFNLIDSAFSGDLKSALRLYQDQRLQKVEPQTIHAMLVWQMHAVATVSVAPKNISSQQIAKESGLNPYVVQKSQRIAIQMGRKKIEEFMQLLRDIDYKSKTSTLDYDEALRFAIITLAE